MSAAQVTRSRSQGIQTRPARITYTREALLQRRNDVTAIPVRNVRRSLWFFGLLRYPRTLPSPAQIGPPGEIGDPQDHVASHRSRPHDVCCADTNTSCDSDSDVSCTTALSSAIHTTSSSTRLPDSRPAQPEPRGTDPHQDLSPRNVRSVPSLHSHSFLDNRLKVATYNVRTLRAEWRLQELIRLASDLAVSIVAIQEHRRRDDCSSVRITDNGWTYKTAPASTQGTGGIGFLLSPSASKALLDIRFPCDRIAHASFAMRDRRLHVLCVYAPTSPNTDLNPAVTDSFYDCLAASLDVIPSRDLCFVMGDFNAPLPVDGHLVKNSCGSPNSNSDYLACFIQARELLPVNGFFRQRFRNLPTFFGPNNRITRLDWVLCPFNMRARVRGVLNIRPKCVNSDHTFLICDTDLRWPKFKPPPQRSDWSTLKDPATKDIFLEKLMSFPNFSESADSFTKGVKCAASALPVMKTHQPRALWNSDPEINEARRQLQSVISRHGPDSQQSTVACQHLERTYEQRTEAFVNAAAIAIEAATDNCRHTAAWKAINCLTGRKPRSVSLVGATSIEQRKTLLASHYESVLNVPPPTTDLLPIPDFDPAPAEHFPVDPITEDEVSKALRSTRAEAAAGTDGIPPSVLKLPELNPVITNLLNSHCCLGGDEAAGAIPSWRTSKIVSISKNNGSTGLDNQRGIALECALPKLLNSVLRNRLLPVMNPLLLGLQSGFRPGRSTIEQLATIRCIVDRCRTRKRTVSIVFVDFRKAFDSLCRPAIAHLLSYYGVPQLFITAVMDLYQNSTAFVRTNCGPTKTFKTSSGVLQGDTLSPLLFILAMDYVLRRAIRTEDSFIVERRRSTRHPEVLLPALAYADDIALLCRDPATAQSSLTRLSEESARVGLKINTGKTKVLHVGSNTSPPLQLPNGQEIESCKDFKYLGLKLMNPDKIISDRRSQAWRASYLLRGIFNAPVDDRTKVRLFRAAVEPILLYGLEAVPMTPTREGKLDAMHRRLLRYALGIRYPTTISNSSLSSRSAIPALSATLRTRRRKLLGHSLRSFGRGEETPLALVLLHEPSDVLRRGHGRTRTLFSTFLEDLRTMDLTPQQATLLPPLLFKQRVRAGM